MGYSNPGIRGVVRDTEGELLVGANVLIEETFVGTSTNLKGAFYLPVRQGKYLLRTTFIGYEPTFLEVEVGDEVFVEIIMKRASFLAEEIIVSALRVGEKAPLTFSTINKAEIQQKNLGQDIPFLLNMTPSLVATSDAGTGVGYTSFRIRGTDMTRINVTVNGIPLNDPESHGVWWVNMPDFASSIENIQIQRGVGTSTNGAAAFGATVNLQTSTLNKDPFGEISSSGGSFNTFKNTVSFGSGLINNKFAFNGRLSKINSDGYIDRASSDLKSFFLSGGYFGPKTIVNVKLFSGKEITYQAWDGVPSELLSGNRTFNGIGRYTDLYGNEQFYENETDNYQQDHLQVLLSREINHALYLNAAFHYTRGYGYYEQYKESHSFSEYGLDNFVLGSEIVDSTNLIRRKILDNDFYGLTYSVNYKPKQFDINIGGAYNRYVGDHFGNIIWAKYSAHVPDNYQWYFNAGVKTDINSYIKVNYQASNSLNLFADIQYRAVDYSIEGIHDDLRIITQDHQYNFLNPKFGLNYFISATQNTYISYSQGNREPSRSNFRDARAGVSPQPEKLHNIEIGYNYKSAGFYISPNFFYMKYKDQLVLTGEINDVGAPMATNVPESYRLGIELAGSIRFSQLLKLDFNAAFSQNKIVDFTEYVDNWDYDPGDPFQPLQFAKLLGRTDLAFSPSIVAGSSLKITPGKNTEISLIGKYVGKQFIDNTSNKARMLNDYFVNDISISHTFKPEFIKSLKISFVVNNLFNVMYESNAWIYRYYAGGEESYMDGYFPQAGIHFMAGLSLAF